MTVHDAKLSQTFFLPEAFARRRTRAFSGFNIAVLTGLLLLVVSIPIWTNPVPPLSDYVNHLARMHVIAALGHDANLSRFYEVDWQPIPNLMMDLIVPVLARVMSVYLAGQLFLLTMMALMLSGALALNRALFGRWSAFPLIAAPLLYNHVFLVGLTNYIFGIGLALWALACWVALRERHWALRLTVSTLFALALFFCHLSSLGVYGVGLLAIEAHRLWLRREEPWPTRIVDFCATGIPFLPAVPLLLASPTLGLADQYYWERLGKIDGLIYVIQCYSDIVALALVGLLTAGVVWTTEGFPVDNNGDDDQGQRRTGTALANGTVFRVLELMPGNAPRNHRTDSIDYAVVMSGEIDMELDGSSVHLKAGDVLVQQGTIHNWVNRGTEPCVIAFVLIAANPVTAGGKTLNAQG